MRYKLLITLLSLIVATGFMKAQERVDTIYNPPIVYSGLPTSYEIADIRVKIGRAHV